MTISRYIRGSGPGHNPAKEPATITECQGNGWAVCELILRPDGTTMKRRLYPSQWRTLISLGYVEDIVNQWELDQLDWELGTTVVADPVPVPPLTPLPVLTPLPPPQASTGKDPWRNNPNLFWNRRLPELTPVNVYSTAYRTRFVNYLRRTRDDAGNPTAYNVPESIWPNTSGFTCPMYIVGAETPKVMVDYGGGWDDASTPNGIRRIDPTVTAALNAKGGVRIPLGAKVSPAADHEMAVYDLTDDTLYEFWMMLEPNATITDAQVGPAMQINPTGRYQTMTAGIMPGFTTTATGRYIDTPGHAQKLWGTAATGLTYTGGRITEQDMIDGVIPHAIDIALPYNMHADHHVWPAWRHDYGYPPITVAPPEGLRFRLPATFNPATIANGFARMVATAARDYGFVINDTSGKASIRFDSSVGFTSQGKPNPWPTLFARYGIDYDTGDYYRNQANVRSVLLQLPWETIEYLPAGWGQ